MFFLHNLFIATCFAVTGEQVKYIVS